MQVYDAKNLRHYDKLAEKRRKRFILKTLFFIGLAIAIAGFISYLLFFSGLLEIREVSVSGLDKISSDEFDDRINSRLNSRWFGIIEYQRNLIFFDSDAFKAEAVAAFSEIKDISIKKKTPHSVNISVTERETAGVWCFVGGCKYFDKEGIVWGEAAKSSGFLILTVDDLRQKSEYKIDAVLLARIMLVFEQLKEKSIFINEFTIPNEFIGDFSVLTSGGYKLMFNTDSDINRQLEILSVFLREKQDVPGFKPAHIDLRLNGRIYYK